MLQLKEANVEDARLEYECIAGCPPENGFMNGQYGISWPEFEREALPRLLKSARGTGLPQGYVPQTTYFLWDEGEIVGIFRLRHYLNDALREGAGHIGYMIRPEFRGRGYATRGLALMIEKARAVIPEDELYFSVNKDNPASLRVQLNNGAYIHHEDELEYYTRIKL